MKYYYDVDREQLLTIDDIKAEYNSLVKSGYAYEQTFSEYLNNCMTKNNGSLDVYSVREFADTESMKAYITALDYNEEGSMVWTYDGERYIDTVAEMVYLVA